MPLAALLDRLGFFTSCAAWICEGRDEVPVWILWVFAALTTAVLNLDTTIVLLTPLYLRLAQRSAHADDDTTAAMVLIPLLLASLASSILPVSNLTTIIATERLDLGVLDVLGRTALPSLAACAVGWWCFRRRHPTRLAGVTGEPPDRSALRVGGVVVLAVLLGFTLGPIVGLAPWMVALAADAALVVLTRSLPWRHVPIVTALGVGVLAALVSLAPSDLLTPLLERNGALELVGVSIAGVVGANSVNNLPAALLGANAVETATWGFWAWLLAINTGAVLLPTGAVANVLWWRILNEEGRTMTLRRYARAVVPVALPAAAAATVVLVAERLVLG